jgi:hypothetical protein
VDKSADANEQVAAAPEGGALGESSPPSTLDLSETQFRSFLYSLARNAGSNAELGRRLDLSGQLIDKVLSGNRRPGPKLLAKLGARAERRYTIVVEAANGSK